MFRERPYDRFVALLVLSYSSTEWDIICRNDRVDTRNVLKGTPLIPLSVPVGSLGQLLSFMFIIACISPCRRRLSRRGPPLGFPAASPWVCTACAPAPVSRLPGYDIYVLRMYFVHSFLGFGFTFQSSLVLLSEALCRAMRFAEGFVTVVRCRPLSFLVRDVPQSVLLIAVCPSHNVPPPMMPSDNCATFDSRQFVVSPFLCFGKNYFVLWQFLILTVLYFNKIGILTNWYFFVFFVFLLPPMMPSGNCATFDSFMFLCVATICGLAIFVF